jgi:hypothetical protein
VNGGIDLRNSQLTLLNCQEEVVFGVSHTEILHSINPPALRLKYSEISYHNPTISSKVSYNSMTDSSAAMKVNENIKPLQDTDSSAAIEVKENTKHLEGATCNKK